MKGLDVHPVLRRAAAMEFVGLRRTQFNEKVAKGELPRPIRISDSGRAVAWLLSELVEWRQSRIAKREQKVNTPRKETEEAQKCRDQ